MTIRKNKPLRSLGIYTLRTETLILLKRSEELSFLFSEANWQWHGPVNYRVSHGNIYLRGQSTGLTDEDLVDTGKTANAPAHSTCSRELRFRHGFANSVTYADLVQQHKENEEIREFCELQRVTLANQRATLKLQQESGKRQVKKQSAG
jgi:hypothetical protein